MVNLTNHERDVLSGAQGEGARIAMEIVVRSARMLGAKRLTPITSSHIDGCLYHGEAGVLFCEKLATEGARVSVETTTNVGALNLLKPDQSRLPPDERKLAFRLMVAHERMGCRPSWTCAPYQAGARPALGDQIAWGESNAVAFANTVLGARTNRYGDFLDIACAVTARAPHYGLHVTENRAARIVLDASPLPADLLEDDAAFPVLGALVGRLAGDAVPALTGLTSATEDQLKALCAGAAATGAVALIHLPGITPEAPTLDAALQGEKPQDRVTITKQMFDEAKRALSLAPDGPIDSVALGSPHFSADECRRLLAHCGQTRFAVPVFVCLGRGTLASLDADGTASALARLGVEFVTDTCVVVTPILPDRPGVMMTNSAKFAHYAEGNTGHTPIFGTLAECAASAQAGRVIRQGAR